MMQVTLFPEPVPATHVARLTDLRCVVALYRKKGALIKVSLHVQTDTLQYNII